MPGHGDASAAPCALLQLLAEWCHECPAAAEAAAAMGWGGWPWPWVGVDGPGGVDTTYHPRGWFPPGRFVAFLRGKTGKNGGSQHPSVALGMNDPEQQKTV